MKRSRHALRPGLAAPFDGIGILGESDELTQGGVPLLDKGTLSVITPAQRGRDFDFGFAFQVVAFPTAGEASIRAVPRREPLGWDPRPEDHLARSVRRSRSAIRRFCVHNGLGYMATLTFRNDPLTRLGVDRAVARFLRVLVLRGVDGPYAWVVERGKKGRLHVHFACNWWGDRGAVEVCDKCATAGLRRVRSDIPPSDSLCVGCLWGQGFVGAPTEAVGDPRGVALYVSKYAAQDFGLEESSGKNRYHVARGFQPPVERRGAYTFDGAVRWLGQSMDLGLAEVTVMHEQEEFEWLGPPLWSFRW